MTSIEDDWRWAHVGDTTDPRKVDIHDVAAVLVVHNAEPWLGRTLASLAQLEPRPHLLAVDASSTDGSAALLEQARQDGLVHQLHQAPADVGFGACVALAEAELDEDLTWLWLLHDDLEPTPDVLQLLRAEEADIVVPKLLEPRRRNHPDQIQEIGQSIGPEGQRVLDVEPGEYDQGHKASRPVLGASTAGLLVRRSAWRRLGGTSPELPLFRDGLDLGWRANAAGLDVRTCPQAALHHRQAGRRGLRQGTLTDRPELTDTLLGLRLAAAHRRSPLLATLGLVLSGLFAALGHLLAKDPSAARTQLAAGRDLWSTRAATVGLHQRVHSAGTLTDPTLLPSRGQMLRRRVDRAAGWIGDLRRPEDEPDAPSIDELTADETPRGPARIPVLRLGLAVLTLLALVAGRRAFGLGTLAAPALAPAPASLSGAWAAFLSVPDGGHGVQSAGWLGLGALGSTLALGRPGFFLLLSQVFALPVAAASSLPLWRRLAPRAPRQVWLVLAGAWTGAIALLGLAQTGRASGLMLGVLVPLAGVALLAWTRSAGASAEAWRAGALLALVATVAFGASPSSWLVAFLAGILAAACSRRPAPLVLLLAPLLVHLPWLPALWQEPVRLFTGSDPLLRVDTLDHLAVWWLGLPAALLILCAACLGLAAALGRGGARPVILVAIAVPLLVGAGVALTRIPFTLADEPVVADPEPFLLAALCCLLVLASQAHHLPALLGMLALAAVLGLSWWVSATRPGLERQGSVLPARVQSVQGSERATRALLVERHGDGSVTWNLSARDLPVWGSSEHTTVPAVRKADLDSLVTDVALGRTSDDLGQRAHRLAIGHLWLRGADDAQVAAISNSQGLGPAQAGGDATTWTVTGLVTRTDEWRGPVHWWPLVPQGLVLAALAVLALPGRTRTQSPRRGLEAR
ncbi:glycosyltransferase [Luteococcus sp.]|uniref:glycosyltransferase family 2 protein n=1 Tax=Luteococcus sp. TaxID=1969402 RepID=UPI00373639A9